MPVTAIFIFGLAGSGKGTQRKLLEEYFTKQGKKFKSIEIGLLLRSHVNEKDSSINNVLKDLMDKGEMVPTSFSLLVTMKEIMSISKDVDYILFDGSSRRPAEADMLFEGLSIIESLNCVAIVIDISTEESLKRLKKRNRSDDNEDAIMKRIEIFNDSKNGTAKVINNLKENNFAKVCNIDGIGSIEEVHKRITDCI